MTGARSLVDSFRRASLLRPSRGLQVSTTRICEPISTPFSIPVQKTGTPGRNALIDTSVAVHLSRTELAFFASSLAISSLTVAELVQGPRAASRPFEKARREKHLKKVEATLDALPFDIDCARAYGRVSAAVESIDRIPRGSRVVDLMIAATALAHTLPLLTRNPKDLRGLEQLIEIVDVSE